MVGYGAPGKGNTLLNHCGIRTDLIEFTVDRNPHNGDTSRAARIPILAPDALDAAQPDYIVVLPWNLRAEISDQLSYVQGWGAKLVFAVPHLDIVTPLAEDSTVEPVG